MGVSTDGCIAPLMSRLPIPSAPSIPDGQAIDKHEIYERLGIRKHGSFLPHGAIFKMSRDILLIGDIWATDLSKLELQNAETKRTASQGGARNLTMSKDTRLCVAPQRTKTEGPAQLVTRAAQSTTMALSTMRKILGTQYLAKGHGIIATPMSRGGERLFGVHGTGRTKAQRAGPKLITMEDGAIDPKMDTCIKAFVRLLQLVDVMD